jgi:hypothetical protein
MINFVTQLRTTSDEQKRAYASAREKGALDGRGAFVETYNTLVGLSRDSTGAADPRAISGRGASAQQPEFPQHAPGQLPAVIEIFVESLVVYERAAPYRLVGLDTVRDAARALCEANTINATPGLPWQDKIEAMLADAIATGDRALVTIITVHGVAFWFVAMRDIKLALGARGVKGAARIRAAMRALGWRPRPAIIHGRRMHGFVRGVDLALSSSELRELTRQLRPSHGSIVEPRIGEASERSTSRRRIESNQRDSS